MKKKFLIGGLILAFIILVLGLARGLTGEDNWICKNGQWVKHGNPSAPMPEAPCK
ncbi:MAG: hypothetical protein M1355_02950 [Patescibacteria group bacterium]|nr:hypothetical protein [Patescibacteria group bacterium]